MLKKILKNGFDYDVYISFIFNIFSGSIMKSLAEGIEISLTLVFIDIYNHFGKYISLSRNRMTPSQALLLGTLSQTFVFGGGITGKLRKI